MQEFHLTTRKIFFFTVGVIKHWMRLQSLQPWVYPKPDWSWPWATCPGSPCSQQGVGLYDVQGPLPTPNECVLKFHALCNFVSLAFLINSSFSVPHPLCKVWNSSSLKESNVFWGWKRMEGKIVQDEWLNITSYASRKQSRLYLERSANGVLKMTLSTPMISGNIHMVGVRFVIKNSIE